MTTPVTTDSPANGEGGRRRGRRGRGRGERREEGTPTVDVANAMPAAADSVVEPKAADAAAPVPYRQPWPLPQPMAAVITAAPTVEVAEPVAAAAPSIQAETTDTAETVSAATPAATVAVEATSAAPLSEPAIASVPAPVVVPPVAQASVTEAAPLPDLAGAGLVMIETARASTQAVTTPPAAPTLGRKPKPVIVPPEEPLQMVETRHP